jgi:DNA-binding ferritin-like protein
MTTVEQLTQVFADNFVAYYRSHVAHVNILGRNFQSDHTLLGGIYESLQDQIDILGELLRSLQAFMPCCIADVVDMSHVMDLPMEGSSEDMLTSVRDDLDHLKGCYEELIAISTAEGHDEIANYAQDRVLALAKQLWMLDSTLA